MSIVIKTPIAIQKIIAEEKSSSTITITTVSKIIDHHPNEYLTHSAFSTKSLYQFCFHLLFSTTALPSPSCYKSCKGHSSCSKTNSDYCTGNISIPEYNFS